ncbi:unnamed protein product [Onchocerca ochengi]|uniref:Helitron_like_N domain-containing protein n=1 Tax=Onchocerca ochengi TaxID=42157 RepID=A0A182E1M4_ONCOC|nr:unnamed protein product [Onchocerca ochengi]
MFVVTLELCRATSPATLLDQRQTLLRVQQSRNYNRPAFRNNPVDDYSLSPHVPISTMIEVCSRCKALKFNEETKGMCEVTIAMVRDQFQPRHIALHLRNKQLTKIAETHQCYDDLQYPIIFWDSADGYHFNVKVINPVDMYAKIETERLIFIRLNQTKLHSKEYIQLRDAVVNDSNTTNVGRLTILPSSYTGSPRHMHEYAQDAIA